MATIVESVTLNFTDLTGDKTGCVTLGSNKFWKGWVEDTGNGLANFECRWGPTGESGSDKGSVRGIILKDALKQLSKKVAEKEKKGYTRLDTRSDQEEMAKAAAKGVPLTTQVAPVPVQTSQFHPDVSRLLAIIYNETSRVVRSGLSAQAGATEDNPIGNLSDRQLDLGGAILDEIESELALHLGSESSANKDQTVDLGRDGLPLAQLIELTNRFMSNVPRSITRDQRGPKNLHRLVISSYSRLEEQRTFLQLLRDAYIAKDIFQAASVATSTGGKEHVWYDGLQSTVEFCDRSSADYKKVVEIFNTAQSKKNSNWWRGSQPIARVARVFKFTRNGTDKRFSDYAARVTSKPGAVGNIMAWHGTRTENLLGIGKSGLLMPENLPPGIKLAGKAFGRGVYHAPAWNATGTKFVGSLPTDGTNGAFKSLNYTSATGAYYGAGNTSKNAFMFLEEVALGLAEGRTSACWDQHRPSGWPKQDFIFACATKNTGGFTHDELVTFDQDAQIFRYLVEIEVV